MTPLRLLFDEDVDHRILRGLRRAHPQIDACTAEDWVNRTDFLPV